MQTVLPLVVVVLEPCCTTTVEVFLTLIEEVSTERTDVGTSAVAVIVNVVLVELVCGVDRVTPGFTKDAFRTLIAS